MDTNAVTDGVTKAWIAQQAAKAACPVVEGWLGGPGLAVHALTVFVAGTPANLKNKVGHWSTRARWAKQWREATATRLYLLLVPADYIGEQPSMPWAATDPKRITFTIYGRSRFDDDNAALVVSPCRDALQDMRVIDNDGNVAHRFFYAQAPPTRKVGAVLGIALRIELAS